MAKSEAIKQYDTDDASVVKLVRDIMAREQSGREGRTAYLQTLTAAVQMELGDKQVTESVRGRVKSIDVDDALGALTLVHRRFYGLVLAELDTQTDLDARERNNRSAFARSAASTLRVAIRTGLNPMSIVLPDLTKEWLREWTRENKEAQEADLESATRKVHGLVRQITRVIAPLSEVEKAAVIEQARKDLEAMTSYFGKIETAPAGPASKRGRGRKVSGPAAAHPTAH